MNHAAFIDLNPLTDEAKKELEIFYEYLIFKYKKIKNKKLNVHKVKKNFSAIQLDTKGFKFNREEANER